MVGQLIFILLILVLPLIEKGAVIVACVYLSAACKQYLDKEGPSGSLTFSNKVKAAIDAYRHPKGVPPCQTPKNSLPIG